MLLRVNCFAAKMEWEWKQIFARTDVMKWKFSSDGCGWKWNGRWRVGWT